MKTAITTILAALLVLLASFAGEVSAAVPEPPEQPPTGPGGDEYAHAGVVVHGPYWPDGIGVTANNKYLIYRPSEPTPDEAPVVLFLHGWAAVTTLHYEVLIRHIVRKGYTVVWVQYQRDDIVERPKLSMTPLYARKILVMWKDALRRINSAPHPVRPARSASGELETAIIGHSAGAYLSAVVASKTVIKQHKIPVPRVIVAMAPGARAVIPWQPLLFIAPDTKVVIVVGDEDDLACTSSALEIWNRIGSIPDDNKEFLLLRSDYHGLPKQVAHHYFYNTNGARDDSAVDARDYYVTFKLTVGALDCAFRDVNCEYAFGNGSEEQIYMGRWSDGEPVTPIAWIEDPSLLETTCTNLTPMEILRELFGDPSEPW